MRDAVVVDDFDARADRPGPQLLVRDLESERHALAPRDHGIEREDLERPPRRRRIGLQIHGFSFGPCSLEGVTGGGMSLPPYRREVGMDSGVRAVIEE